MATPRPLPFGAVLRRHRVLAALTQEALAERAGLSARAISDLERGLSRTPQQGTLELLAEALQLSGEARAAFEAAARQEKLADQRTLAPAEPKEPVPLFARRDLDTPPAKRSDWLESAPPERKGDPPALPTGTVTLLFTDLQRSTRLLQHLGEHYADLLEACRRLLHATIQEWHGHEVDTQGDAIFVAFVRATDALSAAIALQRALFTASWPDEVRMRVRIGMHTGAPTRSADGYLGLDVHRAARIMRVAHGGQVLLSQATRDLVEHALPEDVRLKDLGNHHLKDLSQPTRLFQVVIGGLPADFGPLKTLESFPNNLPLQPTPFIGREQAVAALQQLLLRQEVRLLTLTGPGGVGKTRLALHVAAEITEYFADGTWWVPLASISDPTLVIPTIGHTLGLRDVGDQLPLDQLTAYLRPRQMLVLLDNFEQVIAAAPYLAQLLAACAGLKLLVTSREVLHLRAEQEWAVSALALPAANHLPALAAYGQSEAVTLFLARAQAAQPAFQLTTSNAPTIAELCTRLDGLPLALELAAPRLKLLSPQALLARLEGRLQVLSSGARDLPERQRTMHATITWSYELLTPAEQALFRRLAVFAGGWTLAAVEQVCPAAGALDLEGLEGLAALLDKSLLRQEQTEAGETRFRMLYVLREFGLERLAAAEELVATREAHAAYYLALAEEAEPQVQGTEQKAWVGRLEQEHDNLRAALTWWLERAEQTGDLEGAERALRLCGALTEFWSSRFYFREGSAFQERALATPAGVADAVHLKALLKASYLHLQVDEVERGEALAHKALVLARQAGDLPQTAEALRMLGWAAAKRDQYAVARASMEEAVAFYQQAGDARGSANCLLFLIALVLHTMGEFERAVVYGEEALATFRERGSQTDVGYTLIFLGRTLFLSQRDQERGAALVEQGLALLREVQADWAICVALLRLGRIRRHQVRLDEARSLLEEGVALGMGQVGPINFFQMQTELARLLVQQGELAEARALYEDHRALLPPSLAKDLIAYYLEGRAVLEAALGAPRTAIRLWGAAEALREAIGAPMVPVDLAEYTPRITAARAQLGEEAFAAAWAEGRSMTPEQALGAVD